MDMNPDQKETLSKIEHLAKLAVRDPEEMSRRLQAVLNYVGQMNQLEISLDPLQDPHHIRISGDLLSPSHCPPHHWEFNRTQVIQNYPRHDENGVVVPKFVRKGS
jgi:Asp-tRNA(Asn)/Glu-tRNA(Gln) amidotransferase C subunit